MYIGGSGVGGVTADNRLYGGLVAAQAAVACGRTVESMQMHSVHCHFLRPGRPDAPIRYHVHRSKEGRTFHVRDVTAHQGDAVVFRMTASFCVTEASALHQDPMPEAPGPERLLNRDEARGRTDWRDMAIDVRLCDPLADTESQAASKRVWLKPFGDVPSDPVLQMALFVYATDPGLLSTAWRPHAASGALRGASLDHALWFHEPFRFDDWVLCAMHSPAAANQRGLVMGEYYTRSGVRIATAMQEGYLQRSERSAS